MGSDFILVRDVYKRQALAIQEDFETMGYLAQVYTQTSELDEAHRCV